MQKQNHNFKYMLVPCAVCLSDRFELLYSDKRCVSTEDTITKFNVNVGVCLACGHLYSKAVPVEQELFEYYANSYPKPKLGGSYYSLDKRLKQINRFSTGCDIYYELGANQFSEVHHHIAEKYRRVILDDPNQELGNLGSNAPRDDTVSFAATYGVLEHLIDPGGALKRLFALLRPGGNLLVEVPNQDLYSYNMTNLQFCEHLQHFSAPGFISLASRIGFRPIHVSFKEAGSWQCFLVVLQKPEERDEAHSCSGALDLCSGMVLSSIARVREGVFLIDEFKTRIGSVKHESAKQTRQGKVTILYGANEIAQWVLDGLNPSDNNIIIVDDDPKKINYLPIWRTLPSTSLVPFKDQIGYVVFCSERLSARMKQNLINAGISFDPNAVCVLDFKENFKHQD